MKERHWAILTWIWRWFCWQRPFSIHESCLFAQTFYRTHRLMSSLVWTHVFGSALICHENLAFLKAYIWVLSRKLRTSISWFVLNPSGVANFTRAINVAQICLRGALVSKMGHIWVICLMLIVHWLLIVINGFLHLFEGARIDFWSNVCGLFARHLLLHSWQTQTVLLAV